jgi:NAD(P)-dependent dehydrogenase (short-subunit alcohol dehydrogenase family)
MSFFIREIATELGPFGITAHAISPKNIETERSQRYWRAEQMKIKIPHIVLLYLNK